MWGDIFLTSTPPTGNTNLPLIVAQWVSSCIQIHHIVLNMIKGHFRLFFTSSQNRIWKFNSTVCTVNCFHRDFYFFYWNYFLWSSTSRRICGVAADVSDKDITTPLHIKLKLLQLFKPTLTYSRVWFMCLKISADLQSTLGQSWFICCHRLNQFHSCWKTTDSANVCGESRLFIKSELPKQSACMTDRSKTSAHQPHGSLTSWQHRPRRFDTV